MLTKFTVGRYKYPVSIEPTNGRLVMAFNYNPGLIEEVKVMEGARWHPKPDQYWSVADSPSNRFQIEYLEGKNPYAPYDKELIDYQPSRPVYDHQLDMIRHGLTYHYVIWAAEMGTGKSLAAIEVMEASKITNCLWLGPNSALNAVRLELKKWGSKVLPTLMTYDKLGIEIEKRGIKSSSNPNGFPFPQLVIGDESSRCKNPLARRTIAFQQLTDRIRSIYGPDGYVILMSGTPAPKSPFDWYSQCKLACPGFLREGKFDKFKARLALITKTEGDYGSFPSITTWWDDERKCAVCGRYETENPEHDPDNMAAGSAYHEFKQSVNEVARLYDRMKGLVKVYLKKDCLDLPEKQYRIIRTQPGRDLINAAKIIAARVKSAAECLTLLRELSDGFQYQESVVGTETCWACKGSKSRLEQVPKDESVLAKPEPEAGDYVEQEMPCSICKATGQVNKVVRTAVQFTSPKEAVLFDVLDEYEDIGRAIVYGGFTGSMDKCIAVTLKKGWDWIKADGKGWQTSLGKLSQTEMLEAFQDRKNDNKIVFIAQAGAAGMGLNLSASCVCVYYSNDFNAESRIQSEDRGHRLDMDRERGYMIIDIFCLPTDQFVLDNLNKKRHMQSVTLGEIQQVLNEEMDE